jgi:multimeric flavodoxin WrbA
MSSLCKAFIERLMAFRQRDFALSNKVAGALAVGGARNGGQELTIRSVQAALMSQQMIVVGDAPPTGHWGGTVWANAGGPDAGVMADEQGMASVKNLGRRVGEIALLLSHSTSP